MPNKVFPREGNVDPVEKQVLENCGRKKQVCIVLVRFLKNLII